MFQVAARRMLDTEVLSYGAVQDCQAPAHHKINDDLPWWWQHDQLISEEMKDALCQLINSIDPTVSACETILQTGNCGRLDEERNLEATVLQCSSLVLCTVAMSGGAVMKAAGEFSTCVVDEAAQLVEAHTAVLLHRCPELSQLVLVGDHMQLPATVISEEAKRRGYGVSTFERLVGCDVR